MKTYDVTARRWAHGWELHIDGVGVTQSRTLATAERMVRECISLMLDVPEDSFEVVITPQLEGNLAAEAEAAKDAVRKAAAAQEEAAARQRRAARDLKAAGLSGADVAELLHVTPQRVSQLVNK